MNKTTNYQEKNTPARKKSADPVGFSRRGMKRVRLSLPDPSHWGGAKTKVISVGGLANDLGLIENVKLLFVLRPKSNPENRLPTRTRPQKRSLPST